MLLILSPSCPYILFYCNVLNSGHCACVKQQVKYSYSVRVINLLYIFYLIIQELDTEVYMHIYKYKTMFFTLRAVNMAGVSQLAVTPMVLDDIYPASGVQVFDLDANYNLDSLKDFLHSSNLGNMTKILHDDDVDFTSYTDGISAAILGSDCGHYTWAVQVTIKMNAVIHV